MTNPPPDSPWRTALRWVLLLYLVFTFSPIRYCAPSKILTDNHKIMVDNTWFFALNYGAVHHFVWGRDIVWTWGPLFYLLVPFDVGNNLAVALVAQTVLWVLFAVVLYDLFLLSRLPLRNLAVFSIFFALTSVNYHKEVYPGNLLLPVAFILLVHFRLRRGLRRLLPALIILGLMPMIQFVGTVVAALTAGGFALDRLLTRDGTAKRDAVLAIAVPLITAFISARLALGSFHSVAAYASSSLELARGYGFAMSLAQSSFPFVVELMAFALFAVVLLLLLPLSPVIARFFVLVLLAPVLIELRHGLVRRDIYHVTQFFSITALVLALIALSLSFQSRPVRIVTATALSVFGLLWLIDVGGNDLSSTLAAVGGLRTPGLVWNALHYNSLRRSLRELGEQNFQDWRIEPTIRSVVGQQPVAFLSNVYSNALIEDLNLVLFPVIQRYSAYTPYLDHLNAQWLATKGPPFLLFDGLLLDERHPWSEAPETWVETYRWYNTRIRGTRNLLLERRSQRRFSGLQPIEGRTVNFGQDISFPSSRDPVFWTLRCPLSTEGKLRAALYRVPEVTMTVTSQDERQASYRVIVPVLPGPSLGNYLPSNLTQFAEVFADSPNFDFSVWKLTFGGPGRVAYQPSCQVAFLRAY